jgi:hypothetical protein
MKSIQCILFLILLFFFSCEKQSISPDTINDVTDFNGMMKIALDMTNAPSEVCRLEGKLYNNNQDTINFELEIIDNFAQTLIYDLPIGKWNLRVDALDVNEDIIFTGITEVEVFPGIITPVSIHLNSTTGGLEITVTWGNDLRLVAHYPFNGNAEDESGNDNHGDVIGATLTEDRFGNTNSSYMLNGTDNYINISHNPSLNFGFGNFTVALWVKYECTEREQVFIEKYIERFGDYSDGWTFTKLHNNVIRFAYSDHTYQDIDTDQLDISLDTWHHFAIIRTNRIISIYWNCQLIHTGLMDSSYNLSCEAPIKIGHRGNPSNTPGSEDNSGYFLNGNVDDVEIYKYALSTEELRSIYHSGGWDDSPIR